MKLFGRAKKAPTPQESIAKIRETISILGKREEFLEKKANDQVAEARKCLAAKNKRGALTCLKRKKLYESQLASITAAHDKLEQQAMTIEGATATMEAMTVMKEGATAMKTIHKNMTVEQVENTMEDVREQMDVADEINQAIAQPMGNDALDEDELMGELEQLEQQNMDEQLLSLPTAAGETVAGAAQAAPAAAAAAPAAAAAAPAPAAKGKPAKSEADELAQLEAAMAL